MDEGESREDEGRKEEEERRESTNLTERTIIIPLPRRSTGEALPNSSTRCHLPMPGGTISGSHPPESILYDASCDTSPDGFLLALRPPTVHLAQLIRAIATETK